ncbi:MAG: hypothetical protein A2145_02140 [candidate division Zixibacteria bacterium RBG_16_40_9]|nr:MAG: hypothetical protein A2145_02140 [candidate division Zixibacteria bacterium RBG_16_40_9]
MLKLKEQVEQGVKPLIKESGYELVEVEIRGGGPSSIVKIFIDKEKGVSVEDCAAISKKISDYLDTEDLIQSRYTLEVSSPGLDRPLTKENDFNRKKGEVIKLFTRDPQDKHNGLQGEIIEYKESGLYLKTDSETISIPGETILKAQLVF